MSTIIKAPAAAGGGSNVTVVGDSVGLAKEATLDARTGALTEAAPATDTASSGINGRLQRIAQRLTSLIALLPGSLGQKAMAGSLAVTVASDQASIPVAATLGAETTKVIGTVNIAAGQAVQANAGTNLNTSALALSATQTDGTQKAITRGGAKGTTTAADITSTASGLNHNAGDAILYDALGNVLVGQKAMAGSIPVALASDQSSIPTAATLAAETTKVIGTIRILGNLGIALDAAIAAAVPANAIMAALRAATANPTNATGGNLVGAMGDKAGRQVMTIGQVRELIGIQQTNVAVNTETTVVTAGGVGVFNDLVAIIITTAGAAAQTITIKDATAGTTRFVFNYPNAALAPGVPFLFLPAFAIPQAAANANWTVTQSLATACNYTFVFLKNL